MLFRSGAAICGAVLGLAVSVAAARSEPVAVHSSAVVDEASGDAIIGAASTYNPFRPGWREGGPNTASGERYNPSVWAAAIKTSLRQKFGGVRYGARPKFALVEAVGKKVIVKINDVGPLTPGRIIDLNERAMRYFDPTCSSGSFIAWSSNRFSATSGSLVRLAEYRTESTQLSVLDLSTAYADIGNLTASGAVLPRIMSEALSAIISVEALRLAEIIRGMIEASTTRRPCSPCTRNWSSTTDVLANLNASTLMIADKASDMIRGKTAPEAVRLPMSA